MIKVYIGNIFSYLNEMDGLQNAANAVGPMGAGVAGAIRRVGGVEIQEDAFKVCATTHPNPGDAYSTIPGKLPLKRIIHAVTMKVPGGKTSYGIVKKAFESSIDLAVKEGITKFGCTALGTGVGGLDSKIVAEIMYGVASKEDRIDFVFVDMDTSFIQTIEDLINTVKAESFYTRANHYLI